MLLGSAGVLGRALAAPLDARLLRLAPPSPHCSLGRVNIACALGLQPQPSTSGGVTPARSRQRGARRRPPRTWSACVNAFIKIEDVCSNVQGVERPIDVSSSVTVGSRAKKCSAPTGRRCAPLALLDGTERKTIRRHALVGESDQAGGAQGRKPLAPAEFEERFLAEPIVAIRVLNALDCEALGLMSLETTAKYLSHVHKLLAALSDSPTADQLDAALEDAHTAWKTECAGSDSRDVVKVEDYGKFSTVTAFAGFFYVYTVTFAEAEKYLRNSPLSKLANLIGADTLWQRMARPEGLPAADVENCIVAMQAAAKSGKVPLSKESAGPIWVAPTASISSSDATHNRDRLGLVHLPKRGKTRPIDTTLMRVEFDSNELSTRVELKRPCIFDGPGIRFRALTATECKDGCVSPQQHGFTFSMGSASLDDGQEELTFVGTVDSHMLGWSVYRLDGNLSGLHADSEKHREFADHLLHRTPDPRSPGAYRRHPWELKAQLKRVLGSISPPAPGDHHGS